MRNDFITCCGNQARVIFKCHFDLKNNTKEIHNNEAEPWQLTIVDTGGRIMTGCRLMRLGVLREYQEQNCLDSQLRLQ